ncbi:MAG: rod shape-determining protein RodA [Candidatus Komeilibacteria bacterium CG11_big_fil_rev_8_21_14_0_20_36_20]|uniref:Rod shape-determining protein RodA n=2 Tax=Patescibacteria group TaxID=1783273 RepID=A0A2H0NAX9_9BACT|nr:MAG: rod shape-determining protein RodA [Candidatus Komeilibacteria bacterium CG11_big_fil_rev_8_21_14_0_20_36_20]PIR82051.1 MAG: rod shape-determining protein RodA [Candidatus Komeilibacteria bacterium CG10_big_fil_rev_8_21_14_0_10_36_65]PIZ65028.1 MAG: rod shape-determining protein RodA [Candidatus Roizmanbacteria bacterium CG_4_10_14_0_2_um_filter_36_9]PJC55030.1 MAG: rod shape-determining protein RodA [Candidatus Komeilibacteria bacterium CG_4_9_14_0_2_um_filter_36_13]
MRDFLGKWRKIDWLLFFAVAILLIFSASILYSLNLNIGDSDFLIFKKQILFALSGLILFFLVANVNYSFWSTYSKLIFMFFSLILLVVLIFGTTIKGTTGWLTVGSIGIQPVEFAKIALIIWLARYFSEHSTEFKLFRHIFISGIFTLVFVLLVSLQPDIGSALVLLGTWVVVLLFTGIRRKHFIWLTAVFVIAIVLSWFLVLQPYQKDRILTFFNPSASPQTEGYNVIQSMVAVGSGQIFGRGLALGPQSSLRFLPEPGTDFIFAVIAEDLGLLGVTVLLGLFAFVLYRLFLIMRRSQDDFGAYLVLGVASMLLVQIFVNIGMNMGVAPVTGIPLPLVSAGGSSLWSILIALGIAESVYMRNS